MDEYCPGNPFEVCNALQTGRGAPAWCDAYLPQRTGPNDPCNDISTRPTWCYGTPSTSTYVPPTTLPPGPPLTLLPQQTVPGVPMVPPPGEGD
jgi:hypothetical protein